MIVYVWLNCSISTAHQNISGHIFPSDICVIHGISEENLACFHYLQMWMGRWLTEGKRDMEDETAKKKKNYSADPGLNQTFCIPTECSI